MARNRFFGLTSRVLMLIVAGLLVLSYASIVVNPARLWFVSLVGIFFVPLSVLNLILLLWAVKRRSKSLLIPLLALLPAFFFVGRYVQSDSDEDRIARMSHTGNTIKVVSYNVGRFACDDGEFASRKDCADSVFAFILEQNPDIICLQEFHISDVNNIRALLRKRMSDYKAEYYMFPTGNGAFGNITLSRIPVKNKGVIKFDGSANLAIYTDYSFHGKDFRVYNCHFESYNISLSGLLRAISRKDSGVFAEAGNKMKRSITRRPKQVNQVFSDIENCPIDSFVCGDFNDNPMSYTYYRMTRGRKDAFVEAGDGFGATYATLWPVLRIDYVLFPERFKAVSHEIPRVPYSDHYPVVTEIEL
ncbi:MAG: endonuclease/exonuclease/phosphatase family protein [Bacteroidales bacterium]|nr:endonuclease/exonuclease/phosphatase family protein [Bacteroidales bacterium]